MPVGTYEQSGILINRKFYQYLAPTILSTVAVALNEFVDGIVVSQILGSDAMTMVNMGSPILMAFAVIYTLLGVGGSVVYADHAGRQQAQTANRVFTLTMGICVLVSVLVTVAGLVFLDGIASVLCKDPTLLPEFLPYLRVTIISGVLIMPLQVLITFFPALGSPATGTLVNVVANVVNLLMDVVYMQFLSTGLMGAGLATLTGYVVGALLIGALLLLGKTTVPFARFGAAELRSLPKVLSSGVGPSLNQFGYCIKISFCNFVAMSLAGIVGATVFALCMQVVSIVSIFICGIVSAMTPIAAFLKGQGDFNGIRLLMRTVTKVQLVSNVVLVLILEAFPQLMLVIYAIDASAADMAITGLRIFSAMFIFRGFIFVYMYYFQVIDRAMYASVLSIIDGFAGLIPVTLLLTPIFGINGLWLAFPVLSLLMLVGVAITNLAIAKASNNRYQGLMLIKSDDQTATSYNLTIPMRVEDASQSAENLQAFCLDNGLDRHVSSIVSMALEEMAVYTVQSAQNNGLGPADVLDVLVRIYSDRVVMQVRSIGVPFDSASASDEKFSNINVLKSISESVEFGYSLGMNHTTITVANAGMAD